MPPLHQRFPNVEVLAIRRQTWYELYTTEEGAVIDDTTFASFALSDARHMARLRHLDLSLATMLTAASIAVLCHCTQLQSLRLPVANVSDFSLGPLAALPRLERLLMDNVPCNATSLADLARLTRLTALSWRHVADGQQAEKLNVQSTLVGLRYLNLTTYGDDDYSPGMVHCADVARLPQLAEFEVYHVDNSIDQLSACISLSSLTCRMMELSTSDDGSDTTPYTSVKIVNAGFLEGAAHCLQLFSQLESITCKVSDAQETQAAVQALHSQARCLRHLEIFGGSFTRETLRQLV